jgi:hypothetical protein
MAVTIGLLWTTGNLSALLAHRRRPRAKLEDLGAVAVRLVRHPGDPAAAWPAGDRDLIPGPTSFYATLLVLLALALALVGLGWRTYGDCRTTSPQPGSTGRAGRAGTTCGTWPSARAAT